MLMMICCWLLLMLFDVEVDDDINVDVDVLVLVMVFRRMFIALLLFKRHHLGL